MNNSLFFNQKLTEHSSWHAFFYTRNPTANDADSTHRSYIFLIHNLILKLN